MYFLRFSGLLSLAERKISASSGTVVLTLHRVLPDPEFHECDSPEGMVLRQKTFSELISFLAKRFELARLSDEFSETAESPHSPRIALSFDDGWRDTHSIAFPIAMKHNVPFTVFVCSQLAGQSSPFWPEQLTRAWKNSAESAELAKKFASTCGLDFPQHRFVPGNTGRLADLIACMKNLPSPERNALVEKQCAVSGQNSLQVSLLEGTMSWADAKAIDGKLCAIESHGHSHEILTRIPSEQAQREITESKKLIEAYLGRECTIFAYPNGSWSEDVRGLVVKAGYKKAFINSPGVWNSQSDPFLIPRVNIWEGSVTDRSGNFSATVFRYSVFWRAYAGSVKAVRSSKKQAT
jgi:peptidoglycan/xylan/chitin deacetylase (PgdA/CDA1 family)